MKSREVSQVCVGLQLICEHRGQRSALGIRPDTTFKLVGEWGGVGHLLYFWSFWLGLHMSSSAPLVADSTDAYISTVSPLPASAAYILSAQLTFYLLVSPISAQLNLYLLVFAYISTAYFLPASATYILSAQLTLYLLLPPISAQLTLYLLVPPISAQLTIYLLLPPIYYQHSKPFTC